MPKTAIGQRSVAPRPRVQANTTLITRCGKAETAVLEIGEDARWFEVRLPPSSSALVAFEPVPTSRKPTNRPRRGHRHSSHDGLSLITLQGQANQPPSRLALGRTNANGRYRMPTSARHPQSPDRGRSTGSHFRSDRPPAGCLTWSRRPPTLILPVDGLLSQLHSRVRSLFARTTTSRH
ncbi:uncharacterized protein LY79DRAFT_143512 [Colletotrichum navitas]|uniref:Uncharacterized protein n=1 Tax=Colletotrichum navitas TaxID=681940 RepID=A0AAD8QCM4_9PEZI|nr:uncharacterized protein LY79DRAFT_143512 [Colletotrichum navitas]KAK1599531.1 hypothetical protein LY79DRAFT_143512 [Colletotrichum navitas]